MKKRITLVAWCCIAWIYSFMLSPTAAQEQQKDLAKSRFLVIYRPGRSWVQGKTVKEQPLPEHGKYMLSLYAKGSMKFAGPFTDDAGGAVVLGRRG